MVQRYWELRKFSSIFKCMNLCSYSYYTDMEHTFNWEENDFEIGKSHDVTAWMFLSLSIPGLKHVSMWGGLRRWAFLKGSSHEGGALSSGIWLYSSYMAFSAFPSCEDKYKMHLSTRKGEPRSQPSKSTQRLTLDLLAPEPYGVRFC